MILKMNETALVAVMEQSWRQGCRDHDQSYKDAFRVLEESYGKLQAERDKLAAGLAESESWAATRVMAAEQKSSFLDVRNEQIRIIVGLRKLLKPRAAKAIEFKLALNGLLP